MTSAPGEDSDQPVHFWQSNQSRLYPSGYSLVYPVENSRRFDGKYWQPAASAIVVIFYGGP